MFKSLLKLVKNSSHSEDRNIQQLQEELNKLRQEKELWEDRHKVLTDNLAAAIVIRLLSGKIIYASPYTEVLTGCPLSEILSGDTDFFLKVINEQDRGKYLRALEFASEGEAFQVRYRISHKTGIEMWVESRTVPILDDSGSVISTLSVTLDVTASVRYQKQVEDTNRDLRDFSYMISHDLRAPLVTIKGMVRAIEDELKSSPQVVASISEYLNYVRNAADRLDQLVSSVLEYSRISNLEVKLEPVDLNQVLGDVRRDFSKQLEACSGELEIQGNLPTVLGEPLRIYQIFSNLIGNAIKFKHASRRLHIIVKSSPSKISRLSAISVSDNGLGIAADKISGIFRPFQRAHGSEIEGFGIGLATVKKLIEQCGGQIEVNSTSDQGSTFLVSLKLA
ncbi:MAG: hypothetical protein DCC75_08530 [Proteobacteria bacterium]|nr:MAG: hypothetical protein DCC75_08530 [Pseudomonadota bacterium]